MSSLEQKEIETFKRLVSSISDSERETLLAKMHSLSGDPSSQELSSAEKDDIVKDRNEEVSISELIKNESLLYKFFLWLRSIFLNTTKEYVYIQDKINSLYKKVDIAFPGIIDLRKGCLLNVFYQKICELKDAINFFKPYLEIAYEDLGAYYVFLGSLVCPEITQKMDEQADPYSLPFSREVTSELRSSYIRKIEEILKDMPSHKRSLIYSCATTVEWFYQLLKLPFDRLKNSFVLADNAEYFCKFEFISKELSLFARIICNGGPVLEEVITSLYLFSANKFVPIDSEATDDESRLKEFMNKAMANISMIHMFVKTVPLKSICRIVFRDVLWQPTNFSGAEDWFMKYKEHWKRLFDSKWNSWLKDKKKTEINVRLSSVFGLQTIPLLKNRPWTQIWDGINFQYEYSIGFIDWFVETKFNDLIKPFRTLLVEGTFESKDNHQEFSIALDSLNQVYTEVYSLQEDLSSVGVIGLVFDKISANKLRTLQAQSKVESVMFNLEATVQNIKQMFCDACRTIQKVVGAALGTYDDKKYFGVSNINQIKGSAECSFKDSLLNSLTIFNNAFEMIKELESIDLTKR